MENKTILLVEDDFLNRRLTKKVLVENNYLVLEAKNSIETLDILRKNHVTLVILDIHLGENEQDGIHLGQHIRDHFSIPFIYLTAYENPEIIEKAICTSPYSYLTKPFKNSDLIASIEIVIRKNSNVAKHPPFIYVKDHGYSIRLPLEEITYIESEGNYLLFYTPTKSYRLRSTVKKIIQELPSFFIQTHRAYIVNRKKIDKFNNKSIVIGSNSIPISENYVDSIRPFF